MYYIDKNNHLSSVKTKAYEKIKEIYNISDWQSYVDERLRFIEYSVPEDADESLEQLIQWYINKKSKKVRYAGTKLKKVFLILPPVEQRKVGMALLTGSMSDTEWVCKRLNNYKASYNKEWVINWHPCYSRAVEECWNKYHGTYCGKLLIQFLEEEIVYNHIDELTNRDFYFGLCRRFINRPWFKLDAEKLKSCTYINAYLSVMSKTTQGITAEEARHMLYQWIALLAVHNGKKYHKLTKEFVFWSNKNMQFRVINAWGIDTALYYLLCMNLSDVVCDFLKWDQHIRKQFEKESGHHIDREIYDDLFKEIIIKNFPIDKCHLLALNKNYYDYIITPGQPFTKPRITPWDKGKEHEIPMYLTFTKSYVRMSHNNETYISPKITKDLFNKMIDKNQNFKNLVDTFNLKPTNIEDVDEID